MTKLSIHEQRKTRYYGVTHDTTKKLAHKASVYKFEAFGKQYDNGWFEMRLPFDKVLVTDADDNELISDAL